MLVCRDGSGRLSDVSERPGPRSRSRASTGPRDVVVEDGVDHGGSSRSVRCAASRRARARPSSTRTSTCARPGARTRRRSRPAPAAAAAGGYCAILAMPNTDPVVDSAAVLGALVEPARAEAVVPIGFLAAISKGQRGEELDRARRPRRSGRRRVHATTGSPVVSAGLMRRALQYGTVAGACCSLSTRRSRALSRRRADARGRGVGGARARRLAVRSRSRRWSRAIVALAAYEQRAVHIMHVSAAGLGRGGPRRASARGPRHGGGHPAPPVPHRRRRPLPRPQHEDEPTAPDRPLTGGACSRGSATARSIASRPTTRRTHGTRRTSPSRRHPSASPGWRRRSPSLHTRLVRTGDRVAAGRARADVGRTGAGFRLAGATRRRR